MKEFTYNPSDMPGAYRVCYGSDITEIRAAIVDETQEYQSYVYVIDATLPASMLETVEAMTGVKAEAVVRVDPSKKDDERLRQIWAALVDIVPQAVIAIGGGTIGDLSGLACGTYQRGIPRFYFPTTVLSMVDASIGGKSGIDFGGVKNSIGVIHYPQVVVGYLPFLDTLSDQDYRSGFAEVIKAAVLYSRDFFDRLESVADADRMPMDTLLDILYESSQIKAKICEEPNNKKIRLLYGHAVGHAYEKSGNDKRRHGDCVAIGMAVEGQIAVERGIWNQSDLSRQNALICKFGLPIGFDRTVDAEALVALMSKYKKLSRPEGLLFVVPETIGRVAREDEDCLVLIPRDDCIKDLQMAIADGAGK